MKRIRAFFGALILLSSLLAPVLSVPNVAAHDKIEPALLEQSPEVVEAILHRSELQLGHEVSDPAQRAVDFEGSTTDLFHGQLPRFPREVETAKARGERLLVVSPQEHWPRLEQWCETSGIPLGSGGVEHRNTAPVSLPAL